MELLYSLLMVAVALQFSGVRAQSANITLAPDGANLTAKVGTSISTECVVVGTQGVVDTLYFQKGTAKLSANSVAVDTTQHQISGKYVLTIPNLNNADSGEYSCTMDNQLYKWDLLVYDEPTTMSLTWPNGTAAAPLDIVSNLTCATSTSMPPASFRWFRNNVEITHTSINPTPIVDNLGYGTAESILELTVTSQDAGTIYKCIADLSYLENVKELSVNVSSSNTVEISLTVFILSLLFSRLS